MKKTILLFSFTILALFSFILGIFLYLEDGLKDTMCQNNIHETIISPNQKYKAIVFERNCGATTGFTTQISIIHMKNHLANDSGNIYVAKGHPNEISPRLKWIDNNHLYVDNIKSKEEYKKENALSVSEHVKISYKSNL